MPADPPALSLVKEALARETLVVQTQPIVALSTRRPVADELLVRVPTHDGRLLAPRAFRPVAEEHGLMPQIDRHVIDRAAALAARGRGVHVNLSASSIAEPGFLEDVAAVAGRHGAPRWRITLEISEPAATDIVQLHRACSQWSARGFRIALDNLGVDFAGFRYLMALPVGLIKLEGDFVRDLPTTPRAVQALRAIVALAGVLGPRIVGTGVEDEETLLLLRELGVDYAQGFHLGRPCVTHLG
jgi:EAL domain-containing protein (putative c-di-GMP-specific phosphodiesterase class I)